MPNFIIDCSENVTRLKTTAEIMQEVFDAALSTNLFTLPEIKVRIHAFSDIITEILKTILFTFLAISWKAEMLNRKVIYRK